MHLFTYGTLQFAQVWRAVAGQPPQSAPAVAHGFQVRRVKNALYPGMTQDPNSQAEGMVYFDVSPRATTAIDRFESDAYRRESIVVALPDGTEIESDAYLMPAAKLTDEAWTAEAFRQRGDLAQFMERFA